MSSKIFKSVWLAAICVFLASLTLIMGSTYSYFSALQKNRLKSETELAAQGVSLSGAAFFDGLNTENYRITWIGDDGSVLYDSMANASEMENHWEREEVRLARKDGYGEAVRYSGTLSDKQLYAAKLLPDGSVIRLSIAHFTVWTLLLGFAQPVCLVILLALALSFFLASRLAKRIVKPINEIDLDHPERYFGSEDLKEIEPLLRHISAQQQQLRRDRAQIEKTALIRQEFTANVSHELKTPLHAISGYAELLENGMVLPEDIVPFAAKIRSESTRMAVLVEDIIDLTRLDSGGGEQTWESCDLCRIAENAAGSLEIAAAAADVSVRVEGDTAPMRSVPQLLHSIVYNLCDNAIKYNRPGGTVVVSVAPGSRSTVLTVRDSGIGIPPESLERIFERFYRVDKSRSKEAGGTGLGLSIVKHAVMILGGTVDVRSEPGKGSVFTVTLPNAPAEDGKE